VKRILPILGLFVALGLFAAPAPRLHAQQSPSAAGAAARQANAGVAKGEHMDAGSSEAQYTHTATIRAIARHLHVSTDAAADIFEDFNSGVILLFIAFVLWKALPKIFRGRSEQLAKSLAEARQATENANRVLAEVEARLMRLDAEVEAMRAQMEREAADEEKRILATMETEKQRIVTSAEQEIAAAQAGAQRDLKKFAAELAIDHAMRRIQLSAETDRALVKEFGEGMGGGRTGGEA
jgi:F-type H+-transporting ATPase subunit b